MNEERELKVREESEDSHSGNRRPLAIGDKVLFVEGGIETATGYLKPKMRVGTITAIESKDMVVIDDAIREYDTAVYLLTNLIDAEELITTIREKYYIHTHGHMPYQEVTGWNEAVDTICSAITDLKNRGRKE